MVHAQTVRTTQQKLALFRSCFSGLTHVYGTYDPRTGRVCQIKKPVTDEVIHRHLKGDQPYGVYLLVRDRIRAIAVDFDKDDLDPPVKFLTAARSYGFFAYIERSKSKGYHVWMFFGREGVLAAKARRVAQHMLNEIGAPDTEIFPKQNRLDACAQYGNFINAPIFGALVTRGRTVFLDETNPAQPHPDQWQFLENVRRIPESLLDDIIEINDLLHLDSDSRLYKTRPGDAIGRHALGLTPCAQKMLAEGVSEYQRVACFRLALHLRKAGLPQDISIAALRAWAKKNHPKGNKRVITPAEIAEQTRCAYMKGHRGCGCEDPAVRPHCDRDCPLRNSDQSKMSSRRGDAEGNST